MKNTTVKNICIHTLLWEYFLELNSALYYLLFDSLKMNVISNNGEISEHLLNVSLNFPFQINYNTLKFSTLHTLIKKTMKECK